MSRDKLATGGWAHPKRVDHHWTVDALQLWQHAIKARTRATRAAGDMPEATIDRAGDRS
jgi:hypothetical protein